MNESDVPWNMLSLKDSPSPFHDFAGERAQVILSSCSCALSLLGCLIIFGTYLKWSDIRTSSRKILVYITCADFLTVTSYLISLNRNPSVHSLSTMEDQSCLILGTLSTFSMISSFLWTFSLALYLYLTIVKSLMYTADRLIILFHVLCWGIPLTVAVVALSNHMIGFDEDFVTSGWCWVRVNITNETGDPKKPSTSVVLWMLLAGKGWEILSFICITVLYFLIRYHMWKQVRDKSLHIPRDALYILQKANKKMLWIPAVFLFLRIWGTLRFLLYASGVDYSILRHSEQNFTTFGKVLLYLQGIGDCGQGWANAILFCLFTTKVSEKLRSMVRLSHHREVHRQPKQRSNSRHRSDQLQGITSVSDSLNRNTETETSPLINT